MAIKSWPRRFFRVVWFWILPPSWRSWHIFWPVKGFVSRTFQKKNLWDNPSGCFCCCRWTIVCWLWNRGLRTKSHYWAVVLKTEMDKVPNNRNFWSSIDHCCQKEVLNDWYGSHAGRDKNGCSDIDSKTGCTAENPLSFSEISRWPLLISLRLTDLYLKFCWYEFFES